jgi:cell filamentation protein
VSNYTLPDGITVKNKLGATSHEELERIEADYVIPRRIEIELGFGPKGNFDAAHLKALHRHLFQDVFEWAGHTRDEPVALSDGTIATEPTMRKAGAQPFLIGPAIPAALDDIGAKLRQADYLRDLRCEEFAERAADVMAELNAVHPFREGNGRTQRVFMEQLAHSAGHTLDFTVVSKERMIQASVVANEQGDPSMLRRMFDEISDPARTALLRESIAGLEGLKFDWNDRYVATLTPGHTVQLVFAGTAGDQFMGRTQTEILFGRISDLPEPRPERGETFTVTAAAYASRGENIARGSQGAGEETSPDDRLTDDLRVADESAKHDDAPSKTNDRGKGRGR